MVDNSFTHFTNSEGVLGAGVLPGMETQWGNTHAHTHTEDLSWREPALSNRHQGPTGRTWRTQSGVIGGMFDNKTSYHGKGRLQGNIKDVII